MSGSCCSVVARADPAFTLFFRDTWATTNDGGPAARTAALLVEAPTQANARASHARAGASAPQLLHCCVPPSSLSRWEEEPAAASREERPSATNADLRRSVRAGEQPSGESPTRAAKPASGKALGAEALCTFCSTAPVARHFGKQQPHTAGSRSLSPSRSSSPICAFPPQLDLGGKHLRRRGASELRGGGHISAAISRGRGYPIGISRPTFRGNSKQRRADISDILCALLCTDCSSSQNGASKKQFEKNPRRFLCR